MTLPTMLPHSRAQTLEWCREVDAGVQVAEGQLAGVRVGLEDNFYLPSGDMAKSNGDLVEAAVHMVGLSGRSVATREEAIQILWPNGGGNF